jgi:hypothetical protein
VKLIDHRGKKRRRDRQIKQPIAGQFVFAFEAGDSPGQRIEAVGAAEINRLIREQRGKLLPLVVAVRLAAAMLVDRFVRQVAKLVVVSLSPRR